MKNMFNYLYFKLYRAAKLSALKDTAEFTATIYLGGLISANILVISAFLSKINVLPFLYSNKNEAGLFAFILVVISSIYFLSNKRYKVIIKKYSQETERERKRGNAIVAIYVALSFLLIFAVALYKPGKL
jgi:hypothetical protein